MFEDSLVESQGRLGTLSRGWTAWASLAVQGCLAAALVLLPLLHPERLAMHITPPTLFVPLLKRPIVVLPETTRALPSSAPGAAAAVTLERTIRAPGTIPRTITMLDPEPAVIGVGPVFASGHGVPAALGIGDSTSTAPDVRLASPKPTHSGPVRVSAGVSAGLLLAPIRPVYPAIARAARVEGAVVVEAVISRLGRVESLRVVSGPAMLQSAAVDALRDARYQPYRLNGEAVEVQTTFTVMFRMGS